MTAWLIAMYKETCKEELPALPCQPFLLTSLDRPDLGNIQYLGGGIPADDGSITISGTVTKDGLPADTPDGELFWWYDTEIESFRDMLFHVIIHDHGPPIDGIVDNMWGTYRGGCTVESLGPGLPDNALNNGVPGPNACITVQAAKFEPEEPGSTEAQLLPTGNGLLELEPTTVPGEGDHEIRVTGSGFLGGIDILLGPCNAPGDELVPGSSTDDGVGAALLSIDVLSDCRFGEAISVPVHDDGTFVVTSTFNVTGPNFVVAAGTLEGSRAGAVWLPFDG